MQSPALKSLSPICVWMRPEVLKTARVKEFVPLSKSTGLSNAMSASN